MKISLSLQKIKKSITILREAGSAADMVQGIASLSEARAEDLSFLSKKKYQAQLEQSKASVVLVPEDYEGEPQAGQQYLWVKNPSFELAKICKHIEEFLWPRPKSGIHPTACIEKGAEVAPTASVGAFTYIGHDAKIGHNTVIQAQVYVGKEVQIGSDCWLMPQVRILDYCQVGDRVRIHAGAVLGADGFGYETVSGIHQKVPQIGIVVIEDDVEIGANTTIDRARFSQTRIGAGTKIDNLVQIAHNVHIGKGCIIAAQTGIAGSSIFEDYVVAGGQVGIADHVTIGAQSMLASQTGVHKDIEPKSFMKGSPCEPMILAQRLHALKKRLPELFERVNQLEHKQCTNPVTDTIKNSTP